MVASQKEGMCLVVGLSLSQSRVEGGGGGREQEEVEERERVGNRWHRSREEAVCRLSWGVLSGPARN